MEKKIIKKNNKEQKYILHVDGDNFFVSCEVARRPDLRGKPVIVGEERGIASAMSKEAKALGVTRGMPVFKIKKEYPQVVILPSHFDLYEHYSNKVASILHKYSANVERYSIDECFAEVKCLVGDEEKLIKDIQQAIKDTTGLAFSIGLGDTKTLAKVGSKHNKPYGTLFVNENNREEILKQTKIENIWGIGRALTKSLQNLPTGQAGKKINTAFDFIEMKREVVDRLYSKPVQITWLELCGVKQLNVGDVDQTDRKSFQTTRAMTNFTNDKEMLFSELSRNIEIICKRLREENFVTKKINYFLKYKDGDERRSNFMKIIGYDIKLEFYTNNPVDLLKVISKHYEENFNSKKLYKGTGISVLEIIYESDIQDDLFGTQSSKIGDNGYTKALDDMEHKFGSQTIFLASSMKSMKSRKLESNLREKNNPYEYGLPLPFMGEVS